MLQPRRCQQTLGRAVQVSGFGFWSSSDITVEFQPAVENTGLVFVRRDLPGQPSIPARVAQRQEAQRRTVLAHAGASVEMVEHVLAALAGLAIDNCRIVVDGAEMPGCDGSSQPFVEALLSAGIVRQLAHRPQLRVTEPLRVGDDKSWIEAQPPQKPGRFSLDYQLAYPTDCGIGSQRLTYVGSPENFCTELAAARTFLLKQEAEWLRQNGLALRATTDDVLVFTPSGPINNQLRFADECVRHKSLDVIGDLALAGCDLVGHFVAYRSGHRLNAELVERLLASAASQPAARRKIA